MVTDRNSMYAKLFAQVVNSSLTHTEPIEVRGVFFMMLAIADRVGNVPGIDPAIARIINVPLAQFQEAVGRLMTPDPYSQSQEEGGKRLVRLEGTPGYRIVNYEKYQSIVTDSHRREYLRVKKAESRERLASEGAGGAPTGRSPRENRPRTIEEVMEYGSMHSVPAQVCREFWDRHEEFAQPGREGEPAVWMIEDKDNPNGEAPVRNWRMLLRGWARSEEARKFRQRSKNAVRQEESNQALHKSATVIDTSHGTNQRPANPASAFGSG